MQHLSILEMQCDGLHFKLREKKTEVGGQDGCVSYEPGEDLRSDIHSSV